MTVRTHPQPGDQPMILLVSSGHHEYREYLLDQVARAARVWLFLADEPTWEKQYIVGHTVIDTLDSAAMIESARDMAARMPLSGVLCWDEVRMQPAAELAEALGLPGGNPKAIGRCRDKHQTRLALAAAGVPQAQSVLVSSLEEARHAADLIGYPVVLKPRALGASFGVNGVERPEGIEAGYAEARRATEDGVPYYEAGVLVEEYLDGPEISIDTACVAGRLTPLFVARKISGFMPYFEEVGHHIDGADPLLRDSELLDVLDRAHGAVGLTNAITHTELRLTSDGPKVIEINCRLGGDFIPYVGWVATGIEPGRVAVEVACGRHPGAAATRSRVAAVHFLYPGHDATVEEVTVDRDALPRSVAAVGVLASRGQRLVLPPGGHVTSRYAYIVVVDDTVESCVLAHRQAERAITLRVAEGPPPSQEVGVRYAPGIPEFIGRSNAAMRPDFYTLPVTEQRRLYESLTTVFPYEVAAGVTITAETVIGPDGREHYVRMYRPERITGGGALLYIRGGGFVVGSLATHNSVISEAAANTEMVCFALDFRMAPEHPFPAGLEDCYGALCGIADAADRLGVDPARFVVGGESSGGNMSVVLSMMSRDRGGPIIRGQALISPVLDFTRWRRGGADAPLLTGGEMEHYTSCYCPETAQAVHPYVSPLVDGKFHDLPPAYIMGAELDSLLVDSETYAERLREHGTPVELVVEPGLVHSAVRARALSPQVADAWLRYCAKVGALANSIGPLR